MSKRQTTFELGALTLPANDAQPLHQRVYSALREAILQRRLKPGARLPSTRALAATLGVSRNTVLTAFDQLLAEGYIDSRVGDGSYVSARLPYETLRANGAGAGPGVASHPERQRPAEAAGLRLAKRYDWVIHAPSGGAGSVINARAFRTGVAAVDEFPIDTWARLLARRARSNPDDMLVYGSTSGYRPLRETIASYLGATRGVNCSAEQVIVTAASQDALAFATQMLLNEGDPVWMEEPGYQGARSALLSTGAALTPVPVDSEGLVVAHGIAQAPHARMAYITPSYQYPMGVTMSLTRRLALLEWAHHAGAWILEDDYNSEHRYGGRPIAALQGLDQHQCVIYIGTFSKVMFGALRIGYLVLPPRLVDAFEQARRMFHMYPSTLDQAALTDFIVEGHFARHIRRMRARYAEKRGYLLRQLDVQLPGQLHIDCAEAGLHVLAQLWDGIDDRVVSQRAAKSGVEAQALSTYCMLPRSRGGLVLGYGALNERQIREGVRKLADAFPH
jgi:GntR family transcriptional regulator/MocR family aminotransferase